MTTAEVLTAWPFQNFAISLCAKIYSILYFYPVDIANMEVDFADTSVTRGRMVDDPWDETINLETKFYDEGYKSGHDHGQLHGLYEGRELGQEKAWEIWEEVGYMEGFAGFWVEELGSGVGEGAKGRGKDARALSHARQLLALIDTFPTTNPTTAPVITPAFTEPYSAGLSGSTVEEDMVSDIEPFQPSQPSEGGAEPDLILLLSSIRARYKLLCSSLGVRPRLVAAAGKDGSMGAEEEGDVQVVVQAEGVVQGIEGPMKGVDTRMLRY